MKRIRRTKSLKDYLLEMAIGSTIEITSSQYRNTVIRTVAYNLNKQGYQFTTTEKGLLNLTRVTRLR